MNSYFLTLPFLLISLTVLFPGNGAAEIRVTKVGADGRDLTLSASSNAEKTKQSAPIKFASSTKNVTFQFETSQAVGAPVRLKYKLEGVDPDWRDPESHMVVWLRAVDSKGHVLAGDTVNLFGDSPGWNGHPADTPLVPFRMSIIAPKDANRFRIYFISKGTSPVIGLLVVDDVKLRVEHAEGTQPEEIKVVYSTGNRSDGKQTVLDKWTREGERPELAQVLRRTASSAKQVLFLNDDDPDKFGVWRSDIILPFVKEGDTVTLSCRMAYSIGSGATAGSAEYKKLKLNTYWFRVAAFQVNGLPAGEEVSLSVIVAPPLYQRAEFWLAIVIACCGLLLLMIRLVLWRRMQRQLEESGRRQMVEQERTRIARDIHDDLGATLAQIAMLSEIARTDSEAKPEENQKTFNDIFSLAYESTAKLNEIIWAINPANDTLEHVVRYLCRFAERHLKLAGLRFRLEAPETMPPTILSSAQRHNLFLAAKEALHNAVKHAAAAELALRIRIEEDVLHIRIEDNGKGFVSEPTLPAGHGSANMRHRMEQINGTCQRTSTPGQGTVVEFALPLKQGKVQP